MPSSRQMSFTATPCSARFRAPTICSSLYLLLRMMTSWSRPPSCRNSSYPWSDFKGGGHDDPPLADLELFAQLQHSVPAGVFQRRRDVRGVDVAFGEFALVGSDPCD